ncbi:MAG TPA: N-acetylmuramoyl-L-alanine amidase [Thermoanaerobaculia bacterium]|nr:N-acetylmuramoyl-L-alanine amidase [Thermoanaerobaculia bacterium]
MGKRALTVLLLLFASPIPLFAAPPAVSAPLGPGTRATLDRDLEISLRVVPNRGDAWTRLALRTTGDAANWKTIARLNDLGENLLTDREIAIPFAMLKGEMKKRVVDALFPEDRLTGSGWLHKVVAGNAVEGESLWRIAEWFTGDGANYAGIRAANPGQTLSTRRGDLILVPQSLLAIPFRSEGTRGVAPSRVAVAEDDPAETTSDPAARSVSAIQLAELPVATGPVSLEYDLSGNRPHAVYRLQKGEALYSSVAIRFTGRVYAKDVYEVVDQIVTFNGISDVSKIPVGYGVKIPLELLVDEYRPLSDPRRLAAEESRRESARAARRVAAKNLRGVHVILDPGHGGRDVGTSHDGIWESSYVYDIVSRLKRDLEKKTEAKVSVTTRSSKSGYAIAQRDVLPRRSDHVVLTSPQYDLDNPVVGVHLRWYLANSIFRRAMEQSVPPEKVIFISVHADSLHPSLRGAMAYIPGERYVRGTFAKSGTIYLARSEVRESPSVTQTEEDALRAEGYSTQLASSVINAFHRGGLGVHPFNPIRNNVVRDGREWVPAVIRYNKVPSRLLLEVCNLGNERDRKLIQTRAYRQKVADAVYSGIIDHFEQQWEEPAIGLTAKAAAGK